MTERGPSFDDLVGDDLAPAERERLLRVHELLIQAGPPPELPKTRVGKIDFVALVQQELGAATRE